MFDAYPRQRISYSKVVLPLSLVAVLCVVLYAAFESAGDDARQDSEDPNMKRMRPFLSSQSFEIGLWTRQKGSGSPSPSASAQSSSPEVEELRQELEKARARSEEQQAELSRLRGTVSAAGAKDDTEAPKAPAAAEIPESLWREPPTTAATTAAPVTTKAPTEEVPPKEVPPEPVKDSTITVKTGDKEISIQIGKEVETTSSTSRGPDPEIHESESSDVSTTQIGTSLRANATADAKISDGTLITVRSGQQSIVIQVRDGEQATTAAPSTTSDFTNTTVVESPVKALPDLPELPPEPKVEEVSLDSGPPEKGDKVEAGPKTEPEASTTKGFSAYANLALRTR